MGGILGLPQNGQRLDLGQAGVMRNSNLKYCCLADSVGENFYLFQKVARLLRTPRSNRRLEAIQRRDNDAWFLEKLKKLKKLKNLEAEQFFVLLLFVFRGSHGYLQMFTRSLVILQRVALVKLVARFLFFFILKSSIFSDVEAVNF